jgi:hypothetical protein
MKFALTALIILACLFFLAPETKAQNFEPFDSFSPNLPSDVEKLRLFDFAFYLNGNPEMTGFIHIYPGKNESLEPWRKRATAMKRYVVKKRNLDPARIITGHPDRWKEARVLLIIVVLIR